MKKLIATVICLVAVASAAIPTSAQTRRRWESNSAAQERRYNQRADARANRASRSYQGTGYQGRGYDASVYDRSNNNVYRDRSYGSYDNGSVWDKSRDKITTAGGAVGGAILGGLIGGKKGALIGAITGGAGAAVYTYKIRDKNRRY
jgi:outer membrane lipoprotein SlyB